MRTELAFDGGFYGSTNDFNYVFLPILRVEPRWYRNLDRRFEKEKNTIKNAADFISLRAAFLPDLFTVSNEDVSVNSTIALTANAGMRRIYWDHFSFELGLGAGFAADLEDNYGDSIYFLPEVFLRFGYIF